jgi:hypothetical protein
MDKKKRSSALFVTTDTNNNNNNVSLIGKITEPPEISVDIDGIGRMDRLVLVDQKTGIEWELSISDGNILIEPYDLVEKRDFRINKVIYNGNRRGI